MSSRLGNRLRGHRGGSGWKVWAAQTIWTDSAFNDRSLSAKRFIEGWLICRMMPSHCVDSACEAESSWCWAHCITAAATPHQFPRVALVSHRKPEQNEPVNASSECLLSMLLFIRSPWENSKFRSGSKSKFGVHLARTIAAQVEVPLR
jgi:hypothetical protein